MSKGGGGKSNKMKRDMLELEVSSQSQSQPQSPSTLEKREERQTDGSAEERDVERADRISLTMDEAAVKKQDILWFAPEEPGCRGCCKRVMNKGNISTMITFLVLCVGVAWRVPLELQEGSVPGAQIQGCSPIRPGNCSAALLAGKALLSFGLFGFLGGITNWIAIKMLFDKVPGLYGSGVIPRRFKEIRETVKNVILRTFFDSNYLKKYVTEKAGNMIAGLNADEKIKALLESDEVDQTIDRKLKDLSDRPEGMVLAMMGMEATAVKPMVKYFILGLGSDLAPLLGKMLDPNKLFDSDKLRDEVDKLMSVRLQELTPDVVKRLMEVVMRKHLGWLIIWGNLFGAVLGLIAFCVGFG